MLRWTGCAAVVWLAACGDGKPPADGEPEGEPSADTAEDSGDRADTGDSGTTDSGEPLAEATVTVAIQELEDTVIEGVFAVGVVHVLFEGDAVTVGRTLTGDLIESADGATVSLTLPAEVPLDQRSALAPALDPTLLGAIYALPVYVPADEAAPVFFEGRPIAGLSFHRFLVWLDPASTIPEGWSAGWNLADLGFGGSYAPPRCALTNTEPLFWRSDDGFPVVYPIEDTVVTVPLRGLPASLHLGGTVIGDPGPLDRIAGVPEQVATGDTAALDVVFDAALDGGTFSSSLEDAPPAAHDLSTGSDWRYTLAFGLLYEDDGDGRWTLAGDGASTTTATMCVGTAPAYVRYSRPVSTWLGARLLDCAEGQVGWRLVTYEASETRYRYRTSAESAALTVSSGCTL